MQQLVHIALLYMHYSCSVCFPAQTGYPALIIAATNNNQNMTSLLIAKGADVNLRDDVRTNIGIHMYTHLVHTQKCYGT